MRSICTICARGGSKGVVGKNARELLGKPLLAWTIEQAKQTGLFEAIAFSSDSDLLLQSCVAGRRGYRRQTSGRDGHRYRPETSRDTPLPGTGDRSTPGRPLMSSSTSTSPRRCGFRPTLQARWNSCKRSGARNVITGAPARRSPYFNLVEERTDGSVGLSKVRRSADRPPPGCAALLRHERLDLCMARCSVSRNPAVFYPDTQLFEMPEERSVDIDSDLDFTLVELLLRKRLAFTETTS